MEHLDARRRAPLAPLFSDYRPFPVAVDAVLEGRVGEAVVDDAERPRCARLVAGPYVMFGGDLEAPGANELVRGLRGAGGAIVIAPPRWTALARRLYPHARTERRVWFSRSRLDGGHLRGLSGSAPHSVEVVWADAGMIGRMRGLGLTGVYRSAGELLEHGFAFAALVDGRPVCGASTAIASRRSVEIQVSTDAAHRGRGLATAVSATMVLHCLEAGIAPHWSTSNPVSERLAERLGYVAAGQYEWLRAET